MDVKLKSSIEKVYDDAEKSPDKQSSARLDYKGKKYKLRVQLSNPDWRVGTILITMEPRPNN